MVTNGAPANCLAKWNGTSWSPLPGELTDSVNTIAIDGNDVYIGGYFQNVGSLSVNQIAKWDGSQWSKLGSGVNGSVGCLAISGGNVYAGGQFTKASGTTAKYIAKWNGTSWSALGAGLDNQCYELVADGNDVYAAGLFTMAGGSPARGIAHWNGTTWSALGTGMEDGGPGALAMIGGDVYLGGHFFLTGDMRVESIARWNGTRWFALGDGLSDGALAATASSSNVIVGGMFNYAGGVPVNHIGRWDGESWNALGSGANAWVRAVAATGGVVYAGGDFTSPGNHIAKWDGSAWSALGSGVNTQVLAVAIVGSDVYAGGYFTSPASFLARWNGSSWSAVGGGVDAPVQAMAVIGSDLYVGGQFLNAGSVTVNHIAKWNGSSWSALGSGANSWVLSLAVSGTDLYASGWFTSPANHIAKWNGTSWSALGVGLDAPALALTATGPRLFAGGIFTNVGSHVAVWNGINWSALGSGADATVFGLALVDTNLYVAGYFDTAGGKLSRYFGRWFTSGVCPSSINPAIVTLGVAATNATVTLTAAGDCAWSATANDAWLHTTSSGSGNGIVDYSADANPGTGFRTGSIRIGEQTFTVHQAGLNSTPPTALCRNVTVNADASCSAVVAASAVDNGSFDNDGTIVSRSLSPAGPFPKGVTGVTLIVTDNDGLTGICGSTVTVEDHTPPVITCPGNITTNLPAGVSSAVVHFSVPAASDNCGTTTVEAAPLSGSTFALGTNPVVGIAGDSSGNTSTCTFNVVLNELPPEPHDFAVVSLKAPKKVTLSATRPTLTKLVKVQIQNQGPAVETVNSLAGLVTVTLENLKTGCTPPVAVLTPGRPKTLKPGGKLNVLFNVTFSTDCVPDPMKGVGFEDFRCVATVNRKGDLVPANDMCPRNPAGTDKGCGGKAAAGMLGADVLTDVFVKP